MGILNYTTKAAVDKTMSDARTVLAENASLHAEVERLRAEADANWPCDGGCNVNDGPDEMCSRHGRRVSEVWRMEQEALQRAERAEAENARLTAQLQAVLALCDEPWMVEFGADGPPEDGVLVRDIRKALNDTPLASEPSGSEQ
jgi:hypothetical protein